MFRKGYVLQQRYRLLYRPILKYTGQVYAKRASFFLFEMKFIPGTPTSV